MENQTLEITKEHWYIALEWTSFTTNIKTGLKKTC
jgi:hypothetical protein